MSGPALLSFFATSSGLEPRTFAVTMNKPCARKCASRRSRSSCTISNNPSRFNNASLDATKTPWLSSTRPPSISFKLFSLSVVPLLTKSRMQSAAPIAGAASKAPSAVEISTCSKPISLKNFSATFGYAVTTRNGRAGPHFGSAINSRMLLISSHACGMATARWQPPNPRASCTMTKSSSPYPISANISYPTMPTSMSPDKILRTTSVAR
mmetsp:Transcript_7606/g.27844  ORF Transcript_7606/g.27844 Transcript_7606/m.27844 type:complete len:210 (+) Transcript_7606:353-982(+)